MKYFFAEAVGELWIKKILIKKYYYNIKNWGDKMSKEKELNKLREKKDEKS